MGASLATLSACAQAEPTAPENPQLSEPVVIMVSSEEEKQQIFAAIYQVAFEDEGRDAVVIDDDRDDEGANKHLESRANLMVGCTGALLNYYAPQKAQAVSEEYVESQEDPTGEDYLAKTHVELMSVMDPAYSVVEPAGSAKGCEDAEPELPQNFVATYEKVALDREERQMLTGLTKFVTDQDLKEIQEEVEGGEDLFTAVRAWYQPSDAAQKVNEQSDDDSSGGSQLSDDD